MRFPRFGGASPARVELSLAVLSLRLGYIQGGQSVLAGQGPVGAALDDLRQSTLPRLRDELGIEAEAWATIEGAWKLGLDMARAHTERRTRRV